MLADIHYTTVLTIHSPTIYRTMIIRNIPSTRVMWQIIGDVQCKFTLQLTVITHKILFNPLQVE